MPHLTGFRSLGADQGTVWPDEEVFPTSDGARELRLSKPDELRMGLTYWSEIHLSEHGHDITERHSLLLEAVGHGPFPQRCFVPWSASGDKLVITSLKSDRQGLQAGFLIYDINLRQVAVAKQGSLGLQSCSWSPAEPLVMVVSSDAAEVLAAGGAHRWRIGHAGTPPRFVAGGWTQTGGYCFWNSRRLETGSQSIRFVDSASGRLVAEEDIDPAALLPYDEQRYAQLNRDMWVLVLSKGTRGSGRLLDEWSYGRFDPSTQMLELGIYRPTSDVYPLAQLGGDPDSGPFEQGCSAELQWVSFDVSE